MGNLLDLLNKNVKAGLSDHSADFIGETEEMTKPAIESTFNTLLAGLIEKGKTEKGERDIHKMVSKVNPRILDDVDQLFTRSPQTVNGLVNIGTRDVPEMMNGKHREAINQIATEGEIKRNSTTKIIKLSAPFLLAMLNKKAAEDKLDSKGLISYINGHKDSVKGNLSEDMVNAMQLETFGYDPSALENEKRKLEEEEEKKRTEAAQKRKDIEASKKLEKQEKLASQKAAVVESPADSTGGGMGWLKWFLPLLLLLAVIFFFAKDGCSPANKVAQSVVDTTESVAETAVSTTKNVAEAATDATKAVAETAGNALGAVNEAGKKALEGIKFTAGSAGSQMMKFIEDGASGDGRFQFKNLNFNTGSAAISGETGVEVDNLASILKAYTDVKVQVEGYTDSRGNAEKNQTLSQQRAQAVKNRLVAAGIDAGRIETKGFGADNPVGDNETEEGRAQNRRIEVVIVK